MSITTIRDTIAAYSPPWLRGEVGGSILRAVGTVLDALTAREVEGVKLRFPGVATPTALGAIGNDRQIERGPAQTVLGYTAQLLIAHDTWRYAGSARTVLKQLRAYFAPGDGPAMRTVFSYDNTDGPSVVAVWHQIEPTTGVVTKSKQDNWWWGGFSADGWAIIDGSALWMPDYWDEVGLWDDGGVWDSNMTYEEARSLVVIVKKWRPAHVLAQIIITFDTDLFEESDTRPPNPNGNGEDDAWRAVTLASFMEPIRT